MNKSVFTGLLGALVLLGVPCYAGWTASWIGMAGILLAISFVVGIAFGMVVKMLFRFLGKDVSYKLIFLFSVPIAMIVVYWIIKG